MKLKEKIVKLVSDKTYMGLIANILIFLTMVIIWVYIMVGLDDYDINSLKKVSILTIIFALGILYIILKYVYNNQFKLKKTIFNSSAIVFTNYKKQLILFNLGISNLKTLYVFKRKINSIKGINEEILNEKGVNLLNSGLISEEKLKLFEENFKKKEKEIFLSKYSSLDRLFAEKNNIVESKEYFSNNISSNFSYFFDKYLTYIYLFLLVSPLIYIFFITSESLQIKNIVNFSLNAILLLLAIFQIIFSGLMSEEYSIDDIEFNLIRINQLDELTYIFSDIIEGANLTISELKGILGLKDLEDIKQFENAIEDNFEKLAEIDNYSEIYIDKLQIVLDNVNSMFEYYFESSETNNSND